jgi:hypothetical protein
MDSPNLSLEATGPATLKQVGRLTPPPLHPLVLSYEAKCPRTPLGFPSNRKVFK